jgi:peptidoglycan-associated lipoprotein
MFLVVFVAACANQGQRGAEIEERSMGSKTEAERLAETQARIEREEELQRQKEGLQKGEVPVIRPIAGQEVVSGQAQPDQAQAAQGDLLSQRSIYYDFDRYDIRDDFVPVIEAHAKYLTDNRAKKIAVQGNCDSRGSREYNVALGQRRADNVKRALLLLGVNERQIQTTSFGAEKPMALGQTESAWAKNRRSDIVYF